MVAIRAAHWATSNRQAALILLMTVQQRLTTPRRLAAAQRLVRGRTRRAFIRAVVRDIAFGVQSLGELDFEPAVVFRFAAPDLGHGRGLVTFDHAELQGTRANPFGLL